MPKNSILQIQKISRVIRLLILLVAVIHIGSFFLAAFNTEEKSLSHQVELKQGDTTYSAMAEMTGTGVDLAMKLNNEGLNGLIIVGIADILMYGFIYFFIYQLFSLYQQGQIFTLANISCIKNIGRTLFAWFLVSLTYPILVVLIIRFIELSDTLPLMLSVTSDDLIHLLSGLVILVISWIMSEAMRLQEEQELVI